MQNILYSDEFCLLMNSALSSVIPKQTHHPEPPLSPGSSRRSGHDGRQLFRVAFGRKDRAPALHLEGRTHHAGLETTIAIYSAFF